MEPRQNGTGSGHDIGRGIGRGIGRLMLRLLWPWPAMRKSVQQLHAQKQQHKDNILYIRELARRGKIEAEPDAQSNAQFNDSTDAAAIPSPSFEQVMKHRPAGAPSIAALEKRFLRQKRLALGTCAAFIVMAGYAIAKGNLLGIATLLSCLPVFFMASLSAQLRLWQLRLRRISKEERGGLSDFMREIDGWYWQVLDPEFGDKRGE